MEFELSNMNLYFRVSSAKLWYGDGPFTSFVESGANVLQLELSVESGAFDYTEGVRQSELVRLLGGHTVSAFIHSHPSGLIQNEAGELIKGTLTVGGDDTTPGYAEIGTALRKESFDGVAFALINGRHDLISRCRIMVGIDKPPDKVDFKKREGPLNEAMFLIERFAISFESVRQDEEDTDIQ